MTSSRFRPSTSSSCLRTAAAAARPSSVSSASCAYSASSRPRATSPGSTCSSRRCSCRCSRCSCSYLSCSSPWSCVSRGVARSAAFSGGRASQPSPRRSLLRDILCGARNVERRRWRLDARRRRRRVGRQPIPVDPRVDVVVRRHNDHGGCQCGGRNANRCVDPMRTASGSVALLR